MRSDRSSRNALLAVIAVVLVAAGSMSAVAVVSSAGPKAPGEVRMCVAKRGGDVRVVSSGACKSTEKLVVVNQKGVQGPRGPQGAAGPQGLQGVPGDEGTIPAEILTINGNLAPAQVYGTLPPVWDALTSYPGSYVIQIGDAPAVRGRVAGCTENRFGDRQPCLVRLGALTPELATKLSAALSCTIDDDCDGATDEARAQAPVKEDVYVWKISASTGQPVSAIELENVLISSFSLAPTGDDSLDLDSDDDGVSDLELRLAPETVAFRNQPAPLPGTVVSAADPGALRISVQVDGSTVPEATISRFSFGACNPGAFSNPKAGRACSVDVCTVTSSTCPPTALLELGLPAVASSVSLADAWVGRDAASGLPTGQRQHLPIRIVISGPDGGGGMAELMSFSLPGATPVGDREPFPVSRGAASPPQLHLSLADVCAPCTVSVSS